MSENGNQRGLGDIAPKFVDPLETYFDTLQQGPSFPRKKWIVSPEWQPCEVKSPDPLVQRIIRAQQEMLECHTLPRAWEMLTDLWQKLQCGTYVTKGPNHLQPPIISTPIEIIANSGLGVTVDAAPGVAETVATYTVPDRFVGSLLRFANNIDTLAQVGNIQWNILKNEAPVFGYAGFFGSFGATDDPRPLASHIPIKWGDVITVTASKVIAGPDVVAYTRLQGFMFPAPNTDQTGDYSHFHTG